MNQLRDFVTCVNEPCDPATSGASAYVGLEHVTPGAFTLKSTGAPSEVQSAKTRFRSGDILYGKLRPYLDKAALAACDGICSTEILVLRPKPGTSTSYLLGVLHSGAFLEHSAATTKGVNHPRTSWAAIAEFEWDAPLSQAQARIGAVLSTVQHAIQVEDRYVSVVQDLKQTAMREVFTRGLRGEPLKETEVGTVPASWQIRWMDEFVTLQRGHDLLRSEFRSGTVPVIGATRIMGYHNVPNVRGPGVTVVRSGSSAGHPQFVDTDFWAHNVLLYVRDFHGNAPKFVYYKLCALELHRFRAGVAVPTLNRNSFSRELVAVPTLDEQLGMAGGLDAIDAKLKHHQRKRAVLQDLFKTLLHELMTGRIRVEDMDIDVSEVTSA